MLFLASIAITYSRKSKFFFFIDMIDNMISFPKRANKAAQGRKYSIRSPLEDACPLMSSSARSGICEFSVRYVWNGAKARLRWNTSFPVRPFHHHIPLLKKQLPLFQTTLHLKTDFLFPFSSQEKTALSLSHYNIFC